MLVVDAETVGDRGLMIRAIPTRLDHTLPHGASLQHVRVVYQVLSGPVPTTVQFPSARRLRTAWFGPRPVGSFSVDRWVEELCGSERCVARSAAKAPYVARCGRRVDVTDVSRDVGEI